MNEKKHPESFRPFMRENVQLIIEPHAALDDGDNPLSALHEAFSRFKFIVISDGKPVAMNMRFYSDTGDCYLTAIESWQFAKGEHQKAKMLPKKTADNSPAFTLVFRSGNYTKGRTAAQVIAEDKENGRKNLESQRKWLSSNLAKYPANQNFIDAIDEALKLPDSAFAGVEASVCYTLFSTGIRILEEKKNACGKSLVYDGSIRFIPGMDYPTTVTIRNMYCNIRTDSKGLKQPIMETKEEVTENVISLNFNETLRLFEDMRLYYEIKSLQLTEAGILQSEKEVEKQRKARSSDNQAAKPQGKDAAPAPKKENVLSIQGKTACVKRQNGTGDYSMQGISSAGKTVNIIIPLSYIQTMEADTFTKFVERSQDRSDPVSFKAEFQNAVENGRNVLYLLKFVS